MRARFIEAIGLALESGRGPVVLDAAILLETGWQDLCDLVVFVDSPRSQRMGRAADDRGWSEAAFDSRERAQWPCEEKRRHADYVIPNDAGLDSLRREVDALIANLLPGAAGPGRSPDPKRKLGMGPDAPPGVEPKAFIRALPAEPAALTSRPQGVDRPAAVPGAPAPNREHGSGTGAWQGSCSVM